MINLTPPNHIHQGAPRCIGFTFNRSNFVINSQKHRVNFKTLGTNIDFETFRGKTQLESAIQSIPLLPEPALIWQLERRSELWCEVNLPQHIVHGSISLESRVKALKCEGGLHDGLQLMKRIEK